MSVTITAVPMIQATSPVLSTDNMTPTTTNAAAAITTEDQPSSPPCLDPPPSPSSHNSSSSEEDQIEIQPRSTTASPEPTTESSLTSLKPSPKVVINGIAPHVLDERKSRPRSPVRKDSITGGGGSSKRNLRRLQYIQQCQKQLQQCQESQRHSKVAAATPCQSQRLVVESSPLRVLGSYTFEDLQAQVEFVVDTKEKGPSCPVEIPIKSELKLKNAGLNVQREKSRSLGWKLLRVHVDVCLFKSIASKLKHRI